MSIDWNRTYATILPQVQAISQRHFVNLLQKGVIYKKDFPALRCTKNQTTIAQAETEEQEFHEFFNEIRFQILRPTDISQTSHRKRSPLLVRRDKEE